MNPNMLTSEEKMILITRAAEEIRGACGEAEIGIVLGSGLGGYAEALADARAIDYADVPGFPRSTVPGHAGRFWTGELQGHRVCMMQGRFHAYEGYELFDVTLPIRVMKKLGVETLIVTNAAGGVNVDYRPGDLMAITDFINLSGKNPLTGANLDAFGPRFPDMSRALDREYVEKLRQAAAALGMTLREGVYCWMNGPCFESPAEIRMARVLGADAVGMSTVPEIIVARHMDMRVLGVSCITNMAAGILDQPLNHQEVMETGERVKNGFRALLDRFIASL